MSNRPASVPEPPPEPRGHADTLRVAAETLRYIAREVPRGPWRWAEPDLDLGVPVPTPGAHVPRWPRATEAPEEFAPVVHPRIRTDVVSPEVAEALATLLDRMATRLEQGGAESAAGTSAAEEVERAAVAVARCVIDTSVRPTAHDPTALPRR
jgi:hypothetical protein